MEEEGEERKEKENQQQPHMPLLVSLSHLCLFRYLNWTRKTLFSPPWGSCILMGLLGSCTLSSWACPGSLWLYSFEPATHPRARQTFPNPV